MNKAKKIFCEKCGTKMIRDDLSRPKYLDIFSGTYNIIDSSSSTTVTTCPYGTCTNPIFPGTSHQTDDMSNQPVPIKIRNYTCPSCKWKTQVRE